MTTNELILFNVQSVLNEWPVGEQSAGKAVESITWYVEHTYHSAQVRWAVANGLPESRLSNDERKTLAWEREQGIVG